MDTLENRMQAFNDGVKELGLKYGLVLVAEPFIVEGKLVAKPVLLDSEEVAKMRGEVPNEPVISTPSEESVSEAVAIGDTI